MTTAFATTAGYDDVRAEIDRLVAREDLKGAIALAQSIADRSKDASFHNLAIQLRIEAASRAKAAARPRPDWPQAIEDPFSGCAGIPDIAAPQLNGDVLGGAILHHGSLIVRGMIPPEEAAGIARDVDHLFDGFDAWLNDENAVGPWFHPVDISAAMQSDRRAHAGMGAVMAADSPTMFSRMLALYVDGNVLPAIEGYLGERPVLSFGKTVARRTAPHREQGEFHQDGAFLGNIRAVCMWIALSDCGVDAPGWEIVDRRLTEIVPTGTDDARFSWTVGRAAAARANGGKPFALPVLRAGDALLFDEYTMYATYYSPSMDRMRWALECWFFAPSANTEFAIPMSI